LLLQGFRALLAELKGKGEKGKRRKERRERGRRKK